MVTDVKPVHSKKAYSPMLVTPFPMVTDVKPVQPLKAFIPMIVPPVMITSRNDFGI